MMKNKFLCLLLIIINKVIFADIVQQGVANSPDLTTGIKYYQQGNYTEAAKIFTNANLENALVDYYFGRMLLHGYGVAKNNQLAIKYFIAAADKNLLPAQQWLAKYYLQKQQSDVALNLFKKIASHNDNDAKMYCAAAYLFGYGTKKNFDIARRYYLDAAKQGIALAQYALALDFLQARDKRSHKLGEIWLNKASAQGLANTKFNMKDLYNMAPRNAVSRWLSNNNNDDFVGTNYAFKDLDIVWQNKKFLQEQNLNQAPKMQIVTRQQLYKPDFNFILPNEISINEYFDFLSRNMDQNNIQNWQINHANIPYYPINSQMRALDNSRSYVLRKKKWHAIFDDGRTYPSVTEISLFDFLLNINSDWQLQLNYQQVLTYLYQRAILGDAEAQFELGQFYQYGIVVTKNIQQAITYYELATLQQDVRAEYNLGILYLTGSDDILDYKKGIDWLLDAAFKGNAYAQYVLGEIYEHGLRDAEGINSATVDHTQAMSMYYLASANNYGAAQYRLADYLVKENSNNLSVFAKKNRIKLIKKLYQNAVNNGTAEAILPLAFYDAMDNDIAKQKHAFNVAKIQAKAGNEYAAILLGMLFERGITVPTDLNEALYWYKQAPNNPISNFIIGTYYVANRSYNKDLGTQLLQKAADNDFSYANYNLAIINHDNQQEFFALLNTSKSLDNSKAGLLLADCYLLQTNDTDGLNQAREIYQDFADKGDKDAQVKLGFIYEHGLSGEINLIKAQELYTLSAEQGQPIAQYLLGLMYQFGKIGGMIFDKKLAMTYPNYIMAKKWYNLAKIAYTPAAVALGFIFETVDDDYAQAMNNYEIAANRGDAIGQYDLGLVYEAGKSQSVDISKAAALYLQSVKSGNETSKIALKRIHQYSLNSL